MPRSLPPLVCSLLFVLSLPAQMHWVRLYPAASPPARWESSLVFDAARGDCLLFGGQSSSGDLGDQWHFDGSTWSAVAVATPPARSQHRMAYDTLRSVVVLFGGMANGLHLQDTWEWNGTAWNRRIPVAVPPARRGHAMAYDRVRQQAVIFGGEGVAGLRSDTWSWNGSTWSQLAGAGAPGPRAASAMAFDPISGGLVLFGGFHTAVSGLDDTWVLDSAGWQQRQPPNLPYGRAGHAMVTDAARRRVVLFGGDVPTRFDVAVWEWDGTTWSMTAAASPSPRSGFAMAHDAARRQAVLFGSGTANDDTWVLRHEPQASFAPFGSLCGSNGPYLGGAPGSLPRLGQSFTSRVVGLPSPLAIFASGEEDGPWPLGLFGFPGCNTHLVLRARDLRFGDASGAASWTIAIPNDANLIGAGFVQQVFVLDAAGLVSVSNPCRLTAGR